jgi:hypothetical protein
MERIASPMFPNRSTGAVITFFNDLTFDLTDIVSNKYFNPQSSNAISSSNAFVRGHHAGSQLPDPSPATKAALG